jgi:L-cystine transport system ATP-binding protein
MTPALQLHSIHKRFGPNEILKGVSLQVNKGDVITVLGPSGSGKTTLLRCVNFLEHADKGQITVGDLSVDAQTATSAEISAIRKRTAFVFQTYNLFSHKTALDNVTEGLIVVRKVPKKEAEDIAMAALNKVGLADRVHFYPSQLSGGQQQRVGIARAIAVNPEVILFDEPTSSLDPELIDEVLAVMKKLAEEGTTMVVVTHELSFGRDVGTDAVFMDGGVVVEEGKPRELFSHPREPRLQNFLKRLMHTENET